jgi:hypothetical protein
LPFFYELVRFPYQPIPVGHAVVPLGGRWVRPRTLIAVTVLGPLGSGARDAVLDTAADDTIFSDSLAAQIGLDLTNAPTGTGSAIGMASIPVRYAQVHLRLTDGAEQREWLAWVGFTSVRLPYPMLGFAGCLQFFTSTFHGDREEVELAANSLYTGS